MEPISTAMAIGAGAKVLGNLYNSYTNGQDEKANLRNQRRAQSEASQLQLQGLDNILNLFGGEDQIKRSYQDHLKSLENYNPENTMVDFDWSKYNVKDYLDPSMQYQQDQSNRALQSSLQGKGGLYSGKAMRDISQNAEKFAQTDFGNASNRMVGDRQFGYTDYLNHFNNQVANNQNQLAKLQSMFNISNQNMGKVESATGQRTGINSNQVLSNAGIQNQINNVNSRQRSGFVNSATDALNIGANLYKPTADVGSSGNPFGDISQEDYTQALVDSQVYPSLGDDNVGFPTQGIPQNASQFRYNPGQQTSGNFRYSNIVSNPFTSKLGAF
jgi:hypothetical protein